MLRIDNAVLLVVDLQERLLPVIHEHQACVDAACRLIRCAAALDVPILATEQYRKGLGPTVDAVSAAWGGLVPVEKTRFSACVEPVTRRLAALDRPMVLVAGVETHVCVQQTVVDLMRRGYRPWVCSDAVSSRRAWDRLVALDRMRHLGAEVTTVESAVLEMVADASSPVFKRVLEVIR